MHQPPETLPWSIHEIRRILPHRYPMLLVDRVTGISGRGLNENRVGEVITSIKNVTANEEFFQGHFPHRPIMPGVMLVEAMAQTSALLAYKPVPEGQRNEFLIAAIEEAKFRRPVEPGDQLEFRCELVRARKTLFIFECEAAVDGQIVAEATITAYMIPTAMN